MRLQAKVERKLPILYLIDSIVKNIKKDYTALFGDRIVSIFVDTFHEVRVYLIEGCCGFVVVVVVQL